MERDDTESFTPSGGINMPSCIKTGRSRGPNIDFIMTSLDAEDMLREVSKHPVSERKALLQKLRRRQRIL